MICAQVSNAAKVVAIFVREAAGMGLFPDEKLIELNLTVSRFPDLQ